MSREEEFKKVLKRIVREDRDVLISLIEVEKEYDEILKEFVEKYGYEGSENPEEFIAFGRKKLMERQKASAAKSP